jgi:hypothetical protein
MTPDERERIGQVLFFAGTNWSGQTPDEIINALDIAGYEIVPKGLLAKLLELAERDCDWDLVAKIAKFNASRSTDAPPAPA